VAGLRYTGVTDSHLKRLAALPDLITPLNLYSTGTTDEGLPQLAVLGNINRRELRLFLVTDRTLIALRQAGLLHALWLATAAGGGARRSPVRWPTST
jgi:hypothetical protein